MFINCNFPNKLVWKIDLTPLTDPLNAFSPSQRKRLRSALKDFELNGYEICIEKVDDEYINKFLPLYNKNIEEIGGKPSEVREKILVHPPHNFPYFALSMYKNSEFIGGLIFSDRGDHFVSAYKVFPHSLSYTSKVGATMIAEYYYYKHGIDNNRLYIRRGKDRNLYGENAAIGLAMFKFKTGCMPYMPKQGELEVELEGYEWSEKKDALIFLSTGYGEVFTQALLLIVNGEDYRDKYAELFRKDEIQVEVIKL